MKHFAISRWKLTGKKFLNSTLHGYDTPEEAKAKAKADAEKYGDQYFVTTIQAAGVNEARSMI